MNKYRITFVIYAPNSPSPLSGINGIYQFVGRYASYDNAEIAGERKARDMITTFTSQNPVTYPLAYVVTKIERIRVKKKATMGNPHGKGSNYQVTMPSKY